jgi:hypothetical protein
VLVGVAVHFLVELLHQDKVSLVEITVLETALAVVVALVA